MALAVATIAVAVGLARRTLIIRPDLAAVLLCPVAAWGSRPLAEIGAPGARELVAACALAWPVAVALYLLHGQRCRAWVAGGVVLGAAGLLAAVGPWPAWSLAAVVGCPGLLAALAVARGAERRALAALAASVALMLPAVPLVELATSLLPVASLACAALLAAAVAVAAASPGAEWMAP